MIVVKNVKSYSTMLLDLMRTSHAGAFHWASDAPGCADPSICLSMLMLSLRPPRFALGKRHSVQPQRLPPESARRAGAPADA